MKLGYMTNAFGPLVGEGGGVTSIKDIRYLTLCDDEAVLKKITNVIHCKNPRCITSIEQELPHIFYLADEEKEVYRCQYCDEKYSL